MFYNKTVNEYVWSSVITFIVAFGAAILPSVGAESLDQAAVFGIVTAAARAGVRAVVNLLSTKFSTISSN